MASFRPSALVRSLTSRVLRAGIIRSFKIRRQRISHAHRDGQGTAGAELRSRAPRRRTEIGQKPSFAAMLAFPGAVLCRASLIATSQLNRDRWR